ncbi:hypothetical protein EVAR_19313_1 [Eumeta japonica]|uniref:Uncharacterized protein n=1 Tax=Eumeta variegata TaxID=151549 RepID=A0A4C1UE95_EUMVA|nr:hypothetical protein EVAR_19313_1 [Eumeta japonica]
MELSCNFDFGVLIDGLGGRRLVKAKVGEPPISSLKVKSSTTSTVMKAPSDVSTSFGVSTPRGYRHCQRISHLASPGQSHRIGRDKFPYRESEGLGSIAANKFATHKFPEGAKRGLEKKIPSYTWWRVEDKSIIDFIIVDNRLRSKVVDAKAHRVVNYKPLFSGLSNEGFIPTLATPCENVTSKLKRIKVGKHQDQNEKDDVKKNAWLDMQSAKTNHKAQRKDILKDELKDAESTYEDAKMRTKEYVKIRKNEIKERCNRKFSDNFRANQKTFLAYGEKRPE